MKKGFKTLTVLAAFMMVTFAQAQIFRTTPNYEQDEQVNGGFFENSTEDTNPSGVGDVFGDDLDDTGTAPIDDYAPLLVLGALAIGFSCRKQIAKS